MKHRQAAPRCADLHEPHATSLHPVRAQPPRTGPLRTQSGTWRRQVVRGVEVGGLRGHPRGGAACAVGAAELLRRVEELVVTAGLALQQNTMPGLLHGCQTLSQMSPMSALVCLAISEHADEGATALQAGPDEKQLHLRTGESCTVSRDS